MDDEREALILFYLACGAEINYIGEGDMTPLVLVSMNGHVQCLKTLLEHGAFVDGAFGFVDGDVLNSNSFQNSKDNSNSFQNLNSSNSSNSKNNSNSKQIYVTPLLIAVWNNRFEIIKLLLTAGANVDLVSSLDGRTALHWAVDAPIVQQNPQIHFLLTASGARVFRKDFVGESVLDIARRNQLEESNLLLNQTQNFDWSLIFSNLESLVAIEQLVEISIGLSALNMPVLQVFLVASFAIEHWKKAGKRCRKWAIVTQIKNKAQIILKN